MKKKCTFRARAEYQCLRDVGEEGAKILRKCPVWSVRTVCEETEEEKKGAEESEHAEHSIDVERWTRRGDGEGKDEWAEEARRSPTVSSRPVPSSRTTKITCGASIQRIAGPKQPCRTVRDTTPTTLGQYVASSIIRSLHSADGTHSRIPSPRTDENPARGLDPHRHARMRHPLARRTEPLSPEDEATRSSKRKHSTTVQRDSDNRKMRLKKKRLRTVIPVARVSVLVLCGGWLQGVKVGRQPCGGIGSSGRATSIKYAAMTPVREAACAKEGLPASGAARTSKNVLSKLERYLLGTETKPVIFNMNHPRASIKRRRKVMIQLSDLPDFWIPEGLNRKAD
ncbi:hypothetical protein C8F04DRAFT_1189553 [Mycena alexandri]|uniref:Uncharacterized protein n=1 Tax=Mycena alexandri TaxID=1745969 RepID=A0AAD6WWM9_9AGAR|nr:hypothetical protein C8F04DRAFT_1189553 [Mycena alexandri]